MKKYKYSETLGMIEKANLAGNGWYETGDKAIIEYYKQELFKLNDNVRNHTKQINAIETKISSINEKLIDLKQKYPEEFI